jgi:hypothetical protein
LLVEQGELSGKKGETLQGKNNKIVDLLYLDSRNSRSKIKVTAC